MRRGSKREKQTGRKASEAETVSGLKGTKLLVIIHNPWKSKQWGMHLKSRCSKLITFLKRYPCLKNVSWHLRNDFQETSGHFPQTFLVKPV